MLAKSHLSITIFFVLLLLPNVAHPLSFTIFSLVASFVPDIDSKFSELGKKKVFRIIQIFLKHRHLLHSFIFLIFITFLLALFLPVLSLPVFLGYGLHLIADSFTISGLKLFYPFKKTYCGLIKTGGTKETIIFTVFLFLDILLLASIIFN